MSMTRREFLTTLGGTGLLYAFSFKPGAGERRESLAVDFENPGCMAAFPDIDYRDWIAFGPDGKVSVFTGRTELGQGLATVITAIVTQGLKIPAHRLRLIMGDTDCCPDDGPTTGSSSTRQVGWGFWLACEKICSDLINRASRLLGIPGEELQFKDGAVTRKGRPGKLVDADRLGRGEAVLIDIDPEVTPAGKQYVDRGIPNVNAEKIVTGSQEFVGDLRLPGMLYAGWTAPPYHRGLAKLLSADFKAAQALSGVKEVCSFHGRIAVIGSRYREVRKGLSLVKTTWSKPTQPKHLSLQEARARAKLLAVKEKQGDINAGLAQSDLVVSETYTTQYAAHAQIETDTALANIQGDRAAVWISSQYPHRHRQIIADYLDRPMSRVHVIGMPVGGGFGGRQGNPVNREAAKLCELTNTPIKLIYSRRDQFQMRAMFKAACTIDVTTGVNADGQMIARRVDEYQDEGDGTRDTYAIPNVLVKAYRAPDWPLGLLPMRGTSFVQTCFATESHVDMVAHELGMDPFEFRRKNVHFPAFVNLIDACAEMVGHEKEELAADEGIGLAICVHFGEQLGAAAARVAVDRETGKVSVKRLCGAFDIGTVINARTVKVCLRGGMIMGIGYALSEEIMVDGHTTHTEYLSQYRIPRFSDTPPIHIAFSDRHAPGSPRGCGELPVIPTIGAIANAIFNAAGVRLYSTPFTPGKIKQALAAA